MRESDEGTIARLFHILIAVQMHVLLYFAVKWLRARPDRQSEY